MPEPAMTYAIEPKTRADEDKLAPALHKLMEDDPMVRFFRDPQTNEFLVAGAGQPHIEALVSKLKRRYHTEVMLKAPKVPYRETMRGKAEAQGRHKKQTGGHGQFGDCKLRIEPLPRGSGFRVRKRDLRRRDPTAVYSGGGEGHSRIGSPRISRGLSSGRLPRHRCSTAVITMWTRARCRSSSRRESPSASAWSRPNQRLLEPVMRVEIEAPDEFAGALMGDLSGRRGRVQGMESLGAGER